ncbi:UNVERIFIED_CONTAM: hypothetical protein GTU68_055995, partial [Idotea baltica]|nr:hypothetical protein [Idotea baltica]
MEEKLYFVGIDVGTKSVRAALVSNSGEVSCVNVTSISIINSKPNFYEQSSKEIWKAVCTSVKRVVEGVNKTAVKGIGFDATCSLVVLGEDYSPVSVSKDGIDDHNIIMWMDHRAQKEAETINSKFYDILKFVGGKISLEMQLPKLLWLKRNLNESWKSAKHFFDLPDFLTFKATGNPSRKDNRPSRGVRGGPDGRGCGGIGSCGRDRRGGVHHR